MMCMKQDLEAALQQKTSLPKQTFEQTIFHTLLWVNCSMEPGIKVFRSTYKMDELGRFLLKITLNLQQLA